MPSPEVVKTTIIDLTFAATRGGYTITNAAGKVLHSVDHVCATTANDNPSVKVIEKSRSDPESNLQCALQYARDVGWIAQDAKETTLAKPMPTAQTLAAADVLNERDRQKAEEGWSEDKDNSLPAGYLSDAGAAYAVQAGNPVRTNTANNLWPFAPDGFKPKDFRRDLVRAAALILAEIERIDRIERRKA